MSQGRGHDDFVTRLCEVLHPEHGRRRLVENFGIAAAEMGFAVQVRGGGGVNTSPN